MTEQRIFKWAMLIALCTIAAALLWRATPSVTATGVHLTQPTSVAVISLNRALENLEERTVRENELKVSIDERRSIIEELQGDLDQITKSLDTLERGSNEYQTKFEEAVRIQYKIEFETNLANRLLSQQRTQLQLLLFNRIRGAAQAYAESEGFDVVLVTDHRAQIPENMGPQETNAAMLSRRVLWASERVDITSEVARRMNNEFSR